MAYPAADKTGLQIALQCQGLRGNLGAAGSACKMQEIESEPMG
jgi:hypothetical protein